MEAGPAYQSQEQEIHKHCCLPTFLLASQSQHALIWADAAGRVGYGEPSDHVLHQQQPALKPTDFPWSVHPHVHTDTSESREGEGGV